MFDIGFWELFFLFLLALFVLGPERLPAVASYLGKQFGKVQRYFSNVKDQIDDEVDSTNINKILNEIDEDEEEEEETSDDLLIKELNEITLTSSTSLYSSPEIHARELSVLDTGTTLSVLRNWKVSESEIWLRVELAHNKFLVDPNNITKGWIKM